MNLVASQSFCWLFCALFSLLSAAIFYHPLIAGEFIYGSPEFFLYRSNLAAFWAQLFSGSLPLWNERVGAGQPQVIFGHYPLSFTGFFYGIFGTGEMAYAGLRVLSLTTVLLSGVYGAYRFCLPLAAGFFAGWIYFGLGFVERFFAADTVILTMTLFPLCAIQLIIVLRERRWLWPDVLFFFAVYLAWISGASITFLVMPMVFLAAMGVCAVIRFGYVCREAFFSLTYLLLLPLLLLSPQFFLVTETVFDSNRVRPGLLASIFSLEPWSQFFTSFSLTLFPWLISLAYFLEIKKIRARGVVFALAIFLAALIFGGNELLGLGSAYEIIAALGLLFVLDINRAGRISQARRRNWSAAFIPTCLLLLLTAHFFLLPDILVKDTALAYDPGLYQELGFFGRFIVMFFCLAALRISRARATLAILLGMLVFVYFMRAHGTILSTRLFAIIWYATRDGALVSLCYATLALFGVKAMFDRLSARMRNFRSHSYFQVAQLSLCLLLTAIVAIAVHSKCFKGTTHRMLMPTAGSDPLLSEGPAELSRLGQALQFWSEKSPGFFRVFQPANSQLMIAGAYQHLGIHDAAIYDSTISRRLYGFYREFILGKQDFFSGDSLLRAMPYAEHAPTVNAAFGLTAGAVEYRDFFLHHHDDLRHLSEERMRLWWKLSGTKILLLTPGLMSWLGKYKDSNRYKPLLHFPVLGIHVVEYLDYPANYSRLALLRLRAGESLADLWRLLQQRNTENWLALTERLEFLQDPRNARPASNGDSFEFELERPLEGEAVLVQLEAWHRGWNAAVNGQVTTIEPAFEIYRGIYLGPGAKKVTLRFKPLSGVQWVLPVLAMFGIVIGFFGSYIRLRSI